MGFLFKSLFGFKVLDHIVDKEEKFVRKSVISDYERFNSIEGRYFSFLYMVQDTVVNSLLVDILNNEMANPVEVERIKETYPLLNQ